MSTETINGTDYRLFDHADGPFKITHLAPSNKIGTGGQPVGMSWQTWRKFDSQRAVREAWLELCESARTKRGRRMKAATKPLANDGAGSVTSEQLARPDDADPGEQLPPPSAASDQLPPAAPAKRHRGAVLPDMALVTASSHVKFDPKWAKTSESYPKLQAVADTIHGLLDTLDRGAAQIGVRVGVCLELAKRLVRHGDFEVWQISVFGEDANERQLRYYHALGKEFLKANRQLLPGGGQGRKLLSAADVDVNAIIPPDLDGPANEFVGAKTLADLLDEYGIKKRTPPKPRGGNHGGGAAYSEQQKTKHLRATDIAIDDWNHLVQQFRTWVLVQKEHVHVPPHVLQIGLDAIGDAVRAVKEIIAKG